MSRFLEDLGQAIAGQQRFLAAWRHAIDRGLVNIDPWQLYTAEARVTERSDAVNGRYAGRKVLCFAEREDTDDVACLVLSADSDYSAGRVLIVHDFAKTGTEVDADFGGFWEWFKAAVDDMIDAFEHWDDSR